jgi:hypothetical protein
MEAQLGHLQSAPHWQSSLPEQWHAADPQSQPGHLQSGPQSQWGQPSHWHSAACAVQQEFGWSAKQQSPGRSQHAPPYHTNDAAQKKRLRNMEYLLLKKD